MFSWFPDSLCPAYSQNLAMLRFGKCHLSVLVSINIWILVSYKVTVNHFVLLKYVMLLESPFISDQSSDKAVLTFAVACGDILTA